ELLNSGARDLRLSALSELVRPFFAVAGQLMNQQITAIPAPIRSDEIFCLQLQVQNALHRLSAFEIPGTLGHLDLNPGNIVVSVSGCKFLDWAEAYVGS